MTPAFAGRTVLVTGAGRPGQVGEAVAGALAAAGASLVLVGRETAGPERIAEPLRAAGHRVAVHAAPLDDWPSVERLAARIAADHDRLDAVVHLAGGWAPGTRLDAADPAQWRAVLASNLDTAVLTARAFLPLVRRARGAFVFVASEAALPGARVAGASAYVVAKQGVITVARALAQEEGAAGVRANVIAPPAIRTATNESAMGADAAYVEREQVAATILWLCSPDASAVTGEVIRLTSSAPGRPS